MTTDKSVASLAVRVGKPRAPDFFCIGAEKCGTSWLWSMFRDHPNIGVTLPKELRYFAQLHLSTGLSNFTAIQTLLRNPAGAPRNKLFLERLASEIRIRAEDDAAYLRLFGTYGQAAVGDISPQYCVLPHAGIKHMHDLAPNAKIIMLLRDPASRVISAGKMKAGEANETLTDDLVRQFAFNPFQIQMTKYTELLARYRATFGDRIFVGFLDDVIAEPLALLEAVCNFLGVAYDASFFPNIAMKSNEGSAFKVSRQLELDVYKELRGEYRALEKLYPERVAAWRAKYED